MGFLRDVMLKDSKLVLEASDTFPGAPKIGQFCFIGGILYVYASVNSVMSWFPITNKAEYYPHTQEVDAVEWEIEHALNSIDLFVVAYDEFNDLQFYTEIKFLSLNTIALTFPASVKGRALVFLASSMIF
jgi:hypothetical protein